MRTLDAPFLGRVAVRRGVLTTHELRKNFVPVYRGVYVRRGTQLSLRLRIEAALIWSRDPATVAGLAASALHGSKWVDEDIPVELNRHGQRAVSGIVVRAERLLGDEVCHVRGLRVTTPARTAFDLGRWLDFDRAVEAVDALMNASGVKSADVERLVHAHRGVRGLGQLREVLSLVDGGAESPPETRTRLLLIRSGLPVPETQIKIVDTYGHAHIRLDLGWRRWKVAVEYDGEHHWATPRQRSRDIDRLAELEAMGWRVVRVSAELLAQRPHIVVARVRQAIEAASNLQV
ncbi:endonuclease domain-containing protein [Williamsia sp.]|uniref:endonuclease domain-containing protein n=1 Tax=Williamsia sp. TaxID=1872085 RepID=UPI002F95C0C0